MKYVNFVITLYSLGLSSDVKFSVILQGFPVFHLCVSTSQIAQGPIVKVDSQKQKISSYHLKILSGDMKGEASNKLKHEVEENKQCECQIKSDMPHILPTPSFQ